MCYQVVPNSEVYFMVAPSATDGQLAIWKADNSAGLNATECIDFVQTSGGVAMGKAGMKAEGQSGLSMDSPDKIHEA